MPNVRELCIREVVVATPDTTVAAAAKLMRHHHVGTVVVCDHLDTDGRTPIGILTDRDIVVEIVALERDAAATTLGDIMGRNLVTARETEGVLQALEIMRCKGVRRLPIVREDGHLVGIVSVDDLLAPLTGALGDVARVIAREQTQEASTRD